MTGPVGEAHLIVPTHTTRWLRRSLLGAARQSRAPDSLTVTCDTDADDIRQLLVAVCAEVGLDLTLLRRPHQGIARLSQVRNNAIRMLLQRGASPEARLIFLDGDTVPGPDLVSRHLSLGRGSDLVVTYRINLTPEQTEAFDEQAVLEYRPPIVPTEAQLGALRRRHRRYQLHQFLRCLRLTKAHKPKPLGGHHSVRLGICRTVNGYDEEYTAWGAEDDDFARRVYAAGGTSVIAVRDILVFHQHHPTRAPAEWHDHPNAARYRQRPAVCCRHGIDSPLAQGPVEAILIGPGGERGRAGLVA